VGLPEAEAGAVRITADPLSLDPSPPEGGEGRIVEPGRVVERAAVLSSAFCRSESDRFLSLPPLQRERQVFLPPTAAVRATGFSPFTAAERVAGFPSSPQRGESGRFSPLLTAEDTAGFSSSLHRGESSEFFSLSPPGRGPGRGGWNSSIIDQRHGI
jgi:hypothetical protein